MGAWAGRAFGKDGDRLVALERLGDGHRLVLGAFAVGALDVDGGVLVGEPVDERVAKLVLGNERAPRLRRGPGCRASSCGWRRAWCARIAACRSTRTRAPKIHAAAARKRGGQPRAAEAALGRRRGSGATISEHSRAAPAMRTRRARVQANSGSSARDRARRRKAPCGGRRGGSRASRRSASGAFRARRRRTR